MAVSKDNQIGVTGEDTNVGFRPKPLKVGRPSEYDPKHIDVMMKMAANGKSFAQVAAHLGVAQPTLWDWARQHPEFSKAMMRAKTIAQAFWEEWAELGMQGVPGFNVNLWDKVTRARFREDYMPALEVQHINPYGGALEVDRQRRLDVTVLSDDERDQLEQILLLAAPEPDDAR